MWELDQRFQVLLACHKKKKIFIKVFLFLRPTFLSMRKAGSCVLHLGNVFLIGNKTSLVRYFYPVKSNVIMLFIFRIVISFQFSFTAGSPLCWDISPIGPSRQKQQQTDNTVGTINLNFNVKSYIWKICCGLKYSWFLVQILFSFFWMW